MNIESHLISPARAGHFRSVVARVGGDAAVCLCTAAFVASWRDASLAAPCRERLLVEGPSDGFLLYRDGSPVGWCQAAPRESMPHYRDRSRAADPDPGTVAVTCLLLVPEVRRQGFAHLLLASVLGELRRRAVPRVHAFACRYGTDEDTSTHIEFPESVARRAGMTLLADHPMRPLYGLAL